MRPSIIWWAANQPVARVLRSDDVWIKAYVPSTKLGLIRETFQLIKLAWAMERNAPPSGRRVSSFDQLFRTWAEASAKGLTELKALSPIDPATAGRKR